MRSREPPAAPGLMRNIMSRQEATPSKHVCQEKRLKVGLGADTEGRRLGLPRQRAAPLHPQPPPARSQAFPPLPPFLWGHRHLLRSPEVGGRGPLEAQAGQVHGSVGHQVEDSDHGGQRVQLPSQEHQLDTDQEAGRSSTRPAPHQTPTHPAFSGTSPSARLTLPGPASVTRGGLR